jgi:hypothetical protein
MKEVHAYLKSRWPGACENVMGILEGSLGIKIRDFVTKKAVGKVLGPLTNAFPPLKIALAVGKLGLSATGKALFHCYDDIYKGYNPYSPTNTPEDYVKFLLWTWEKNGKPSYLFLHD